MTTPVIASFREFLSNRLESGPFATDDLLATFLPLFRQVHQSHEAGAVAPLQGLEAIHVDGVRAWFSDSSRQKISDLAAEVQRILGTLELSVDVVETEPAAEIFLPAPGAVPSRPAWVPGYQCWEQLVGHHDALTDIFCLGQILASAATGLDFFDSGQLERFARARKNLFALNDKIHPVIARVIVRATELDRNRRARDLPGLTSLLANYRRQDTESALDSPVSGAIRSEDAAGRNGVLLDRLQKRLFDISRRNRLLHFSPSRQAINLTEASVPLSWDYQGIDEKRILTAGPSFVGEIAEGKAIPLDRFVNLEEAEWLIPALERLYREYRRDLAEFGIAQLRLVLCVFSWSNLKTRPFEQFTSPLVLLPVTLQRQRGVRDSWTLVPQTVEAEINPVVRYLFRRWYEIELPETVDLTAGGLEKLFEDLQKAVTKSEPGVELARTDRPQVQSLQMRARQRLERYQRRARLTGRGMRSFLELDYNYDPESWHPLGIRLFAARIRPPEPEVEPIGQVQPSWRHDFSSDVPDSSASPVADNAVPAADNGARLSGNSNPYHWQFDLCNVCLANFRYRKMSLVRDYERLVETRQESPVFDSVFSLSPRTSVPVPAALPYEDRFDVVPCDPTQAGSVALARTGTSYIIQGPPGTGKSQTITNLIVDYVARGKRVLFVCEKRAAIDVVNARLRQTGLGQLCSLIHDSQADKKSFVMDLKETYEAFLGKDPAFEQARIGRENCVAAIKGACGPLGRFGDRMQEESELAGIATGDLLETAIELKKDAPALGPLEQEVLPFWKDWNDNRTAIDLAMESLRRLQPDQILARHPLRNLAPEVASHPTPLQWIQENLREARKHLENLGQALAGPMATSFPAPTLEEFQTLIEYCRDVKPLVESGLTALLDPASESARSWDKLLVQIEKQQREVARCREAGHAWRERIKPMDLASTLETAKSLESNWFPAFRPSWWRLRSVMNRSYDFNAHPVKPRWSEVLSRLDEEYRAIDELAQLNQLATSEMGWKGTVDELAGLLKRLRDGDTTHPPGIRILREGVLADVESPGKQESIFRLAAGKVEYDSLQQSLGRVLTGYRRFNLPRLTAELDGIGQSVHMLPEWASFLRQFSALPEPVRQAFSRIEAGPRQIEAATAVKTLERIRRDHPDFGDFDEAIRRSAVDSLAGAHRQWLGTNTTFALQVTQQRFLENVSLAASATAVSGNQDREFRKTWNAGRKILEREFAKQMRYQAIRELVAGEAGKVIRDLKPVWLMSPLSVSDTLPLDEAVFDVVIFDEASQLTLESAVPSLFRAAQAIVVGDEQQLPPTRFFSARDEDDALVEYEEEGESFVEDLDGSSLLNHATRNLPSALLGWHYRSRDESLISFSNWAFYGGRLMTIPEENLLLPASSGLEAASAEAAIENAGALVDRAISFHFMKHGVYENRRNRGEADYIAELVRQVLKSGDNKTIGVIAFSEAQQAEIEAALDRIAGDDEEFARLLEAELVREDDGQFTGLLVKNLENIQGDERDIVILSICYGPDRNGRMLMNFGPINQGGGEKRLNVAFSRAKHQMAVVSSIRHSSITNAHNTGANCLRGYLRYAEALSAGDAGGARSVLQAMAPPLRETGPRPETGVVAREISARLAKDGWICDPNIGHSAFRCDLGVRKEGDQRYRLGILIDGSEWYRSNADSFDRELARPRLLESFGWKVRHVLALDWYRDADGLMAQILSDIEGTSGSPRR